MLAAASGVVTAASMLFPLVKCRNAICARTMYTLTAKDDMGPTRSNDTFFASPGRRAPGAVLERAETIAIAVRGGAAAAGLVRPGRDAPLGAVRLTADDSRADAWRICRLCPKCAISSGHGCAPVRVRPRKIDEQ